MDDKTPQSFVPKTKYKKVQATHVAQKCPVCNGFGTVGNVNTHTCQACNGKCIVLVPAISVEDYEDMKKEGNNGR